MTVCRSLFHRTSDCFSVGIRITMAVPRCFTWCLLRPALSLKPQCHLWGKRLLFSKTGHWDREFKSVKSFEIEEHWKPIFEKLESADSESDSQQKYYVLSMFPYPSGRLHMGHVRVYTISDALARYHRMKGRKVIHPMGWDAFGLPAENAAIEHGLPPDQWTYSNIANMKKQIKDLCCSFDWKREFATSDSSYYRWTQYIFLKMYEAGLVYQKQAVVNWDPVDKTVLADEQIDEEGCSWRSGARVEKKYLGQWYLRTSAYAKSLWDGLEEVNPILWNDVIALQRNWIGECKGCHFEFLIKLPCGEVMPEKLSVFTDHPEAVYGISHIALSHDHRLNDPNFYKGNPASDTEEIELMLRAVHPFTQQDIPLIVSLSTKFDAFNDCCLGIPCLLETDARLAREFALKSVDVYETKEDKEFIINSGQFSELEKDEAFTYITQYARKNKFGGHLVSNRLRDWLISRQRYWGTPIPLILCPSCQIVPVPFEDLPVKLPKIKGRGALSLSQVDDWVNVTCPRCKGSAKRETDTMDTFVDSSWYFLRYLDPFNDKEPISREQAEKHMPVDLYVGGKEHAVLHLYYARFVSHFLHDQGLLPQREPFTNLLTQGMVMGESYRVKNAGRYIPKHQVDFTGKHPVEKETGAALDIQWEKMSKSKHNGIDPEDVVKAYGVDSTRLCILAGVAPKTHRNWSNDAFKGILHWQSRVWGLVSDYIEQKSSQCTQLSCAHQQKYNSTVYETRNYFLKEVTFHLDKTFLLSVAISRLQGLTNSLKKIPMEAMASSQQFSRAIAELVIMLAPFAPCFSSELWAGLAAVTDQNMAFQWNKNVHAQKWPVVDKDFPLPLMVKKKGKILTEIQLPKERLDRLTLEEAYECAKNHDPANCSWARVMLADSTTLELDIGYRAVLNIKTEKQTMQT